MGQYVLRTLGCKANLYDSQLIETELQSKGWTAKTSGSSKGDLEGAEVCIINSCTVTDEADRQTRKLATRLARENPNAKVIITGCGAEVNPESYLQVKGVHSVVGNQNKPELVDLILASNPTSIDSHILKPQILGTTKNYKGTLSKHPEDRLWPTPEQSFVTPPVHLNGESGKTRAFLKIQEGCNSFCTYCIIPYGRGPNRSLRPRDLIEQVQSLVGQGIREIVITGTNIGDYGTDWDSDPQLGNLLEMILNETSIERLRVSSLDPTEITPQIFALMESNPRFCPHFHVSLQSPHSRILKLMKRRYGFDEVKACLERISKIKTDHLGGPFVGMDVITGFPGETDEEFDWGFQALTSLPWQRLHVFPYSERTGTPATRLPNTVPQHVRVQRAKRLNQLSLDRMTDHYRSVLQQAQLQQISISSLLLEKKSKTGWISGYTPNYIRVQIASKNEQTDRNQSISITPIDLMIDRSAGDVALVGT